MPTPSRRGPSRLFRALLGLLPFEFRADFGSEMEAVFEDQARELGARRGRWGRGWLWVRTAAGILRVAPREHLAMIRQDTDFALRVMRRSPGFAATAIVTLTLGIGTTAATFSLVNAVLLRPLPYPDANRLVMVRSTAPKTEEFWPVSYADYQDWKQGSHVFEEMSTFRPQVFTLTRAGEAVRVQGLRVSPGFLPLLGVRPALGRGLLPADEASPAGAAVVLGHGAWLGQFGGARDVVGRVLTLDGRSATIVGILPPDFAFPIPADLVVSLDLAPAVVERGNHAFHVLARVKPGVTLDAARQDIAPVVERLAAAYPTENRGWGVRVVDFHDALVETARPSMLLLLAAVLFVLLIACTNVGNLLLARTSVRAGEIGVRQALGAGRLRILRQLLTESLVIAAIGGGFGVLLAFGLLRVMRASLPPLMTSIARVSIDLRVLAFTILVSAAAGIVFGLAPALRISRTALVQSLRNGTRSGATRGRARLRAALVVSQVAMALMLLVAAGLLIRSVGNLATVDPGIRTTGVLAVQLALPQAHYRDPERTLTFYRDLVSKVAGLPGVDGAALVNQLPMSGFNGQRSIVVEGRPLPQDGAPQGTLVGFREVTSGYFRTLGIPLRRGRLLADGDAGPAPSVVLINEAMAARLWPGADPVGRRLALVTGPESLSSWMTIVGVVGDIRHRGPRFDAQAEIFLPPDGRPGPILFLVAHSTVPPATLVPSIRRVVHGLDRELPLGTVQGMDDLLAESTNQARVVSRLLAAFGSLALLLATFGLYGVVSYTVTQRTHEIGLRLALGASWRDVLRLIVGHAAVLAATGAVLGLVGALVLSQLLTSQLFGVSPTDPAVFVSVAVLVMLVALGASYGPARRAARIDPMAALRFE
jgi:putative ABC transport system permease protein